MSSRSARLAILVVTVALGACVPRGRAAPAGEPFPVVETMVADRLIFGRAIPEGGAVSDAAWTAFVEAVVTPRFPEGLTVWRAEGQWTDPQGRTVKEPVIVIEIFHPASARADSALAAIAREYRRRFRQDAVLQVSTDARVRFFE